MEVLRSVESEYDECLDSAQTRVNNLPGQPTNTVTPSATIMQTVRDTRPFPMTGDINTAAALRAQYAIDTPKISRRRHKKAIVSDEVEPLVDNTAKLELHSKKTERLQKRQIKRSQKAASQPAALSLMDLPIELLLEILYHLKPSDILRLSRTSHQIRDFIISNEDLVARRIIRRRYWNLFRCFPLPIAFKDVPQSAHAALLSPKRQEMLNIHRKSYHQHVQMVDPHEICTCMTCVFAWNNLSLIVDLHHWQSKLENREPIPMIARGTNPQWNLDLLERNANIVRTAMDRNLVYACILEKHLSTITDTILRSAARSKKKATTNSKSSRLYSMTDQDVKEGTDRYLERSGPPSYDFPFHRDNYYALEAYLPNRKWSSEKREWFYYGLPPLQHERDLEWVMAVGREVKRQGSGTEGAHQEKRSEGRVADISLPIEPEKQRT